MPPFVRFAGEGSGGKESSGIEWALREWDREHISQLQPNP
jgi:hypothetical protein